MKRRTTFRPSHPQPHHHPRHIPQQLGEILSSQRRLFHRKHLVAAQTAHCTTLEQSGELRIVVHRRRNAAVVDHSRATSAPADPLHRLVNPGRQQGVLLQIQATHRSQQAHLISNHVESAATFHLAETDHHRLQGVQPAGNRLLQLCDHPSSKPHGIHRLMGPRTMAAFSLHQDLQLPCSGGETTAADPHRANWQVGHHMQAEQRIQPLHSPRIPHPHRPLGQLLRRLKQQTNPCS